MRVRKGRRFILVYGVDRAKERSGRCEMSGTYRVKIRDLNERGQGVGTVLATLPAADTGAESAVGTRMAPVTYPAMRSSGAGDEGKICFVDGALPGETVLARLLEDKKKYMVLDLAEVESPSADRRPSDCAYFPECGSCQLRHLSYEAELRFKEKRVYDLLHRAGVFAPADQQASPRDAQQPEIMQSASDGIKLPSDQSPRGDNSEEHAEGSGQTVSLNAANTTLSEVFRPIIGMDDPFHYRGKTIFPVGGAAGGIAIGQYRRGTNDLVDLRACHIQNGLSLTLVNTVRELANRDRVSAYDKTAHRGSLRHLVVRTAFSSKQVMLVFAVNDGEADAAIASWMPRLAEKAAAAGYALASVWLNRQTSRNNRILSDQYQLLFGSGTIEEEINGVRYIVSPDSFFQVNPVQAARLFREVVHAAGLKPGDTALDLYCGVGAISLQLAFHAGEAASVFDDGASTGSFGGVFHADSAANSSPETVSHSESAANGFPGSATCADSAANSSPERVSLTESEANGSLISSGTGKCSSAIHVLGIDNVRSAVEDARASARLNGIENAEFIEADASEWLRANGKNANVDVIVVDPPRKGLTPDAIDIIQSSGCKRLVYVSCNPATLARDLASLSSSFAIRSIQPVDLFPRTVHVETVCLMSLKAK